MVLSPGSQVAEWLSPLDQIAEDVAKGGATSFTGALKLGPRALLAVVHALKHHPSALLSGWSTGGLKPIQLTKRRRVTEPPFVVLHLPCRKSGFDRWRGACFQLVGMGLTLEHCGTAGDLLHTVVEEGLPGFVDHVDRADRSLPRFVHRELAAFVACGDLNQGFAWLTCEGCDHHRLVPFFCKGRGFCPSCGGRRMSTRAAHWVDQVLPVVGVRQWVLTFPWKIRLLLARRHDVMLSLLRIASEEIEQWTTEPLAKLGHDGVRTGSVTVIQRFGSALRLNVHAHMLWLDGSFSEEPDGRLRWHPAPPPSTAAVQEVVDRIAGRCEAWLVAEGVDPCGPSGGGCLGRGCCIACSRSTAGRARAAASA